MKKYTCSLHYIVLLIAMLLLLVLIFGCLSGPEGLYYSFLSFGEGSWPVEGYTDISSDIMNIHFKYPIGWKGNIKSDMPYQDSSESPTDKFGYTSDDDYVSTGLFMEIAIGRHYEPAKGEGFQPYEPKEGVKTIMVGGIPCDDFDYGIDPETGEYRRSLLGRSEATEIRIEFKSSSGRTAEEYREVTDRILESFEIDFDKW